MPLVTLIRLKGEGTAKEVVSRQVPLSHQGDEKTVFRFTLNAIGSVTNVNYLPYSFTERVTR